MAKRLLAAALIATMLAVPATARTGLRIGVVAPADNDSFAVLGDQVRAGIEVFAQAHGGAVESIIAEPETCDAESGEEAADSMIDASVDAVVGFFCAESLDAALPMLSAAGIVTIGLSVRADIVMEEAVKHNWPFFRLAPHEGAEIATIVDVISKRWAGEPFAIVEDGTIYGRELAENVRVALETLGITAAFIDTYRPAQDKQFGLAHRLQRAGVTHVFIGGDRSDVAIIARDCAAIGLDLTFMGGDAMRAPEGDVPLPDGVLAVLTPAPETLPSAKSAIEALRAAGYEPYGYRIPAYAAGELLVAAKEAAKAKAIPLGAALASGSFTTALGTIRFDETHERADNPFELMVWQGEHFVPVEKPSKAVR